MPLCAAPVELKFAVAGAEGGDALVALGAGERSGLGTGGEGLRLERDQFGGGLLGEEQETPLASTR